MAKRCAAGLVTQSVIFPADYGLVAAKRWLKKNRLKAVKVDRTKNTMRFRQRPVSACKPGNFATIAAGQSLVKLVLCCPK
jgi:hypothetical protein